MTHWGGTSPSAKGPQARNPARTLPLWPRRSPSKYVFQLTFSMPHIPASQALARFRVVDMTQVRAGPTAARQLADWGADVIQVQMPEHMRGDDTLGGQEGSDYKYTHRNKR